jgi:hypothetical protein
LPAFSALLFLLGFLPCIAGGLIAPHYASGGAPPVSYKQAPAVIDTRTTFSDGAYDPETLVRMALERGIKILFLNDHDRMAIEYGLPPFRSILKKKVELNSINKMGADRYLAEVKRIRENYPGMVIIPGAESAPFYYWTGNPLRGNLTAHDHERRILTVGLEKAEDYKTIPLFDPYHGPRGAAPYQHFIDDVNKKGGLTFWNYPETRSGVRRLGPIYLNTPPYPQVLLETYNYTGFAALYGDNITATQPGGLWDKALVEYCGGFRKSPPWGIATSDYHEEGESGQKLGDFQTVFLLLEHSEAAVLDALKKGRIYARRGKFPRMPGLDEFTVSDSAVGVVHTAVSGETINVKGNPRIKIVISGRTDSPGTVRVRLIRSGELIEVFSGKLPLTIDYVDSMVKPRGKIYYRVDMKGGGTIVSNPIFVRVKR